MTPRCRVIPRYLPRYLPRPTRCRVDAASPRKQRSETPGDVRILESVNAASTGTASCRVGQTGGVTRYRARVRRTRPCREPLTPLFWEVEL